MKLLLNISLILLLSNFSLIAETAKKSPETLKEKKEITYRDKDRIEKLITTNRLLLHKLKVMVSNFGNAAHLKRLKTYHDNFNNSLKYKKAKQLLKALKNLELNLKEITTLFREILEIYKVNTEKILSDCSDKLSEIELMIVVSSSKKARAYDENMVLYRRSLDHSYKELKNAVKLLNEKKNLHALETFRLSKLFAIRLMLKLADNVKEKRKTTERYGVDLADIRSQYGKK